MTILGGPWKLEHSPYALCAKKGVPAKTAAVYLLLEGWKGEMAEFDTLDEPFHFITSEGLLSAGELNLAAEVFWGTESEAPGPAEIMRNIQENSARLAKVYAEVKGLPGNDGEIK